MKPSFDLSLYLVTDPAQCAARGVVETVLDAVEGGVTLVQLRDKSASGEELTAQARALKNVLAPLGVPLIVNDDIEAAIAADADGAHVGQGDLDPRRARDLLGPDRILGLSIDAPDQARAVPRDIVDYIGAGPVFATTTKTDHKAPIGVLGAAAYKGFSALPTVAIGGLGAGDARQLIRAGLDGVAVVSAICAADDPRAAAAALRKEIEGERR